MLVKQSGWKRTLPLLITLSAVVIGLVVYGAMLWPKPKEKPVANPVSNSTQANSLTLEDVVAAPAGIPLETLDVSDVNTSELFNLTNQDRAAAGVAPLVRNRYLDKSAQDKCDDMVAKKYLAHFAPDGTPPWVFIEKYIGNDHRRLGENLAGGYPDAYSNNQALMNSPQHRDNILTPQFNYVGFGVCVGTIPPNSTSVLLVVEHFAQL